MNRDFVLAPMMGKTDSQFRYLVRKISKEIVLFTEMIHSNAILFGNKKIFEEFTNKICKKYKVPHKRLPKEQIKPYLK